MTTEQRMIEAMKRALGVATMERVRTWKLYQKHGGTSRYEDYAYTMGIEEGIVDAIQVARRAMKK